MQYIKDGMVGRGIHALNGSFVAVYPSRIVKETDKKEIAKLTGTKVDLIL
jgi:hypothetical protein